MVGEDGMDLDEREERKSEESEKKSNPNPVKESEREEGEEEEGRTIRGPKAIYTPSREEWDNHMRSHIPFRRWCPFCVKGRSKAGAHRSCEKSEEEKKNEVPVISIDYMEPKSEEEKKRLIKSLPIIGMIDRHDKWVSSMMVPQSGLDSYAIGAVVREIELSGYNQLILKSDQGPDILNLLRAVKRERKEDIRIMPEESPVGEHQSNGEVERANQTLQGQFRSMKLALESRYGRVIRSDHSIFPWLVMYAGVLINICKIGPDGRTPYERRKGKRFNQTLPEFGRNASGM
jgi:thiol-disulfide isomerase/thioredoxin